MYVEIHKKCFHVIDKFGIKQSSHKKSAKKFPDFFPDQNIIFPDHFQQLRAVLFYKKK